MEYSRELAWADRWETALDKDYISNQRDEKQTVYKINLWVRPENKRFDLFLTPHTQINHTWVKD